MYAQDDDRFQGITWFGIVTVSKPLIFSIYTVSAVCIVFFMCHQRWKVQDSLVVCSAECNKSQDHSSGWCEQSVDMLTCKTKFRLTNLNVVFKQTINKVIGLICAFVTSFKSDQFFFYMRTLHKKYSFSLFAQTLHGFFVFNSRIYIFPFMDKYTYNLLCLAAYILHAVKMPLSTSKLFGSQQPVRVTCVQDDRRR